VHHTALACRRRKLLGNRIEHRLIAIAYPQANFFDSSLFQVLQQVFPRLLILAIPDPESQDLPLSGLGDADHRQNRHLAPFVVVDHGEVRARGLGVGVALGQGTGFPLLILSF
jgi:hypothetical protein